MPKVPFWIFIVIAILHFTAVRVDIMDIDASQYAEISREMTESGDYLHIYDRGRDYLDKPPFLFWVSAISMNVFGVNNFGYRLPSILFALLALYATYRFARLMYKEETARMAALVLGCCQGMFLMTNDVRTDTILMSWTITALWLLKEWDVTGKLKYFFGGCAAIAFGMMTKGPIALLVPVFCFGVDWLLKRERRKFLQPVFIPGLLLMAVLLLPMSIGLYQQYDMHPEKIMDGKTGVSGLRFFYWTQSFGRITGENTWDNNAPFSFLYENMLWAFLPWIVLFTMALLINICGLFRQRLKLLPGQEWLTTGGFIITYIALGSSHYQLPHYIFIIFPLAAIMVAKLLEDLFDEVYQCSLFATLTVIQTVISALLLTAAILTFTYVFKGAWWNYAVAATGLAAWCYILYKKPRTRIIWLSVMTMFIANIIMTNHFYYTLLRNYQAGSKLGRFIYQNNIPGEKTYIYKMDDPVNIMHFYGRRVINRVDTFIQLAVAPGNYITTGKSGLEEFNKKGIPYKIIYSGTLFKGSELTLEFINPCTREKALKWFYLVQFI